LQVFLLSLQSSKGLSAALFHPYRIPQWFTDAGQAAILLLGFQGV
jgi:hypothetical protein